MMATKCSRGRHIDYIIPDNDDPAANEYVLFIVRECWIRGILINIDKDVDKWRYKLHLSLAIEAKIARLMNQTVEGRRYSASSFGVLHWTINTMYSAPRKLSWQKKTTILWRGFDLWSEPKKNLNTLRKTFRPKYSELRYLLPTDLYHLRVKMMQNWR